MLLIDSLVRFAADEDTFGFSFLLSPSLVDRGKCYIYISPLRFCEVPLLCARFRKPSIPARLV
jgi:hypothetical protein